MVKNLWRKIGPSVMAEQLISFPEPALPLSSEWETDISLALTKKIAASGNEIEPRTLVALLCDNFAEADLP